MNIQQIIGLIDQNIKQNGREEITGNIMNSVLKLIIQYFNQYNKGFNGVLRPNSTTQDNTLGFWLATEGTYPNFNLIVPDNTLAVVYYENGQYKSDLIDLVDEQAIENYINERLVEANLGFGGEITSLNQSPTTEGMYIPTIEGVYSNFGGLSYDSEDGFVVFLYKDGQFSKINVPLDITIQDEVTSDSTNVVSSSAVEKYAIKKINTIAELRITNGEYEGQIIDLLGYYSAGDKNTLKYKWTATQGVDDGGSVINSGSGSWIAQFGEWVSVKDFGAIGNGINDETISLDKTFNFGLNVLIPKGIYKYKYIKIGNTSNRIGIQIKGEGVGHTKLVYDGEFNTRCLDITVDGTTISNCSISYIEFDGNKKGADINFYRHTDLDIFKCSFINHVGKGCIIDRCYQVSIKNTKFTTTNDITPECLLYIATNAITVDSECYFNGRRVTKAIVVSANTYNNLEGYSVKIKGNVFESCTQGVYANPNMKYETLIIKDNYFELIEPTHVPVYLDSSTYTNFVISNNYINTSTKNSVVLNKINRRSYGIISQNKLHRGVAIYTEDGVTNPTYLNARGLPSVSIINHQTLYKMEGVVDEGWVPNVIVDDTYFFQELSVKRFNDSSDIRMPNIKGRTYKRSGSSDDVELLNIGLSDSGGATYARTLDLEYYVLWRQGNKNTTGVNSNVIEKHKGTILASYSSALNTAFQNSTMNTSSSPISSVKLVRDTTNQSVKLVGNGQLDNSMNEWIVDFELNLFN